GYNINLRFRNRYFHRFVKSLHLVAHKSFFELLHIDEHFFNMPENHRRAVPSGGKMTFCKAPDGWYHTDMVESVLWSGAGSADNYTLLAPDILGLSNINNNIILLQHQDRYILYLSWCLLIDRFVL
ncbi:MAG: hypothetical protein IKV54_04740, partial [Clostridia bacterium]|nr:hypothetical protein [Clostridia bacterium]